MSSLPNTPEAIRTEFADRYNYFSLCRMVAQTAGTKSEAPATRYLREAMVILGYPQETASWDDARTVGYAQNIVMIG